MVQKLSKKLALWSAGEQADKDDISIIAYGYTLMIETAYKMLILLLLALISNHIIPCLVTIGTFSVLRFFAGGSHCKTSIGCTLGMMCTYLLGVISGYIYTYLYPMVNSRL